jgi:hypothetical protein
LAEAGIDIVALQGLLAHVSPATTGRYIHVTEDFLERSHRQFHPFSARSPQPVKPQVQRSRGRPRKIKKRGRPRKAHHGS